MIGKVIDTALTRRGAAHLTVLDLAAPEAERTPIEVLRTESPTCRAVLDARRNRREAWFKLNPAHIDLCNVPLPVRPSAAPSR